MILRWNKYSQFTNEELLIIEYILVIILFVVTSGL
jgi:hypothetical protein